MERSTQIIYLNIITDTISIMIFYWVIHIIMLLPWISSSVDAISTRVSPIGALSDRLMHAVVMDGNMKYVLTWTPKENDVVFQIEVIDIICI